MAKPVIAVLLALLAIAQSPSQREWSDTTGKFRTRASLVGVESAEVVLERDGERIRVPVHRLSLANRQQLIVDGHIPKTFRVLTGKVIGITDGDTLTVLDAQRKSHKIRLEGIDTPELGQPFGKNAKSALSKLAFGKQVEISWSDRDKYSRTLGHIYAGKTWINKELIQQGVAWHYGKYSTDQSLAVAEIAAKRKKAGLWRERSPIAPWDWRKLTADERVAAATGVSAHTLKSREKQTDETTDKGNQRPAAKFWLNTKSNIRHNTGCRYFAKTKAGRNCSKDDGKACGICGG